MDKILKSIEDEFFHSKKSGVSLFAIVSDKASDIIFTSRSVEEYTLRSSKTPGICNIPDLLDGVNTMLHYNDSPYEFEISSYGDVNEPSISLIMHYVDEESRRHEDELTFPFSEVLVKINRYRTVSDLLE